MGVSMSVSAHMGSSVSGSMSSSASVVVVVGSIEDSELVGCVCVCVQVCVCVCECDRAWVGGCSMRHGQSVDRDSLLRVAFGFGKLRIGL
jgi:hypothetical protein